MPGVIELPLLKWQPIGLEATYQPYALQVSPISYQKPEWEPGEPFDHDAPRGYCWTIRKGSEAVSSGVMDSAEAACLEARRALVYVVQLGLGGFSKGNLTATLAWLGEHLATGQLPMVDQFLREFDELHADTTVILAILAITRSEPTLAARDAFLSRCETVLRARLGSKHAEHLLQGRR